ncbi:MAG: galactose-1-epimerase [[Pasteurella] aerogenes]|nr:galactose-1-epimerase [[Pasteurella] aerogenes]
MLEILENNIVAPDNQPFQRVTLQNLNGMRVQFLDWGATWISCQIPVGTESREVLLGCKPEDYEKQTAFMGGTIGRYANRIANACYPDPLADQGIRRLAPNQGQHQLHGGVRGFDKVRWKISEFSANFVQFSYVALDREQGFPGSVEVYLTYELLPNNTLLVQFEATPSADTPLNLTSHVYFNLNDAENGADVRSHFLQLNADHFLPVDSQGIPSAPLKSVDQTSFDFRKEKTIAQDFLQEEQQETKGYDHAFLLNSAENTDSNVKETQPCAILTAPDRSLSLQVFTSQSAIQVYTANYLGGTLTRQGNEYADYAGIALETQALPDTPNHPEWWKYGGMSKAGERYYQWTKFSFVIPKP